MKYILDKTVDNIIIKQKKNILFFNDYVITSNYNHNSELFVVELSSVKNGELFYSTVNKDYMLYVIRKLYNLGRMYEQTFGRLYYEVSGRKSIAKLN